MIPENVMRELRYIEVYTTKKVRNMRVGPYTSPLRGHGFDFAEHQPYRPGDDVRRIDWEVTARMGEPYVRHTHAERELNVMVVMDASQSMNLGTSHYSKKEILTFITGSLLFSAVSDQINIGFMAFADRVLKTIPPRRTRGAAWAVLEECWSLKPSSRRTAIVPAIRHLLQTLQRMTVIFLVSDFITDEAVFGSPELSMLAAKHDVIAVVPEDAAESLLPSGRGYMNVRDMESGRNVAVALGSRARQRFGDQSRLRRDALTQAFYKVPMDHVYVPTSENPVEPLLSLFARRMGL